MSPFEQLGLSKEILKAISELGFKEPSEIQSKAIPKLLTDDRDFIGLAQTGTGKTAAFGLPLIERLDPFDYSTQALILAPTRELGQQIAEQLTIFSKYLPDINVLAVYGGANIVNQMKALKNPQQIVIATPGRLIDLIKRKAIFLDDVKYVVLDEADEMLNMGFQEDIDKILSYTPATRKTWLFSATMADEIRKIVRKYMEQPLEVRVSKKNEVNKNIEHYYTVVSQSNKTDALMRFMDVTPEMKGVVFCRTKRDTQNLAEKLMASGYRADGLHGDMSQHQRDRVMRRFKDNMLQVLIATDVAARGIDVNDLTHVFHFSLPDDNAYYTHRSGRTARAGKEGYSVAFIGPRDKRRLERLSMELKISFSRADVPGIDEIADARIETWAVKLLATSSKTRVHPEITEKAHMLLGGLTKDELIDKLVAQEVAKLNIAGKNNLNENLEKRKEKGGRRESEGKRRNHRRKFEQKRSSHSHNKGRQKKRRK